MKHKHWVIIAYNESVGTGIEERYLNHVDVNIENAATEKHAILEAQKIIKRNHYVLRSVKECSQCKLNEAMVKFYKKESGEEENI